MDTATRTASQVRTGRQRAIDSVMSALGRAETSHEQLNAFTLIDPSGARHRAEAIDQLVAVGYALGLNGEPSVTAGILSAKNRTITAENGVQLVNLLQTDAAINPGNSGGPLLNDRGEVVGINTAIAGQAQNIGFAIAITPVMDVIDELRGGTIPERALMGVTTQTTGEGLGVEIVEIADGSGAADSSLREGDVIVAVNSEKLSGVRALARTLGPQSVGSTVDVAVRRGGDPVSFKVVIAERPEA